MESFFIDKDNESHRGRGMEGGFFYVFVCINLKMSSNKIVSEKLIDYGLKNKCHAD